MKKKVISRYLSETTFVVVKRDFGFLVDRIKQSGFEYGLEIRDNYMNLYCKFNEIGRGCINVDKLDGLLKKSIKEL